MHIYLAIISIISILLFLSITQFSYAQISWTTYRNPTYGIEIPYPDNWQVDVGELVDIPGDYVTTIAQIYPTDVEGENEEVLPVYVEVGIDNSIQPTSIEEYLDDEINFYIGEDTGFEDTEILYRDTTKTNISGQPGYNLLLSTSIEGEDNKILESGTIYNGKPYFITYWAEEELYEKYLPIIQNMISYFRFIK